MRKAFANKGLHFFNIALLLYCYLNKECGIIERLKILLFLKKLRLLAQKRLKKMSNATQLRFKAFREL